MNPDRLKDSPPKKLQHQGTPSAAITVLDSTSRQLKAREIEIERLSMRRWQPGDVFAPHDLSPIESRKWKQRKRPSRDVFDVLGLKIEDVWKVSLSMSCFVDHGVEEGGLMRLGE